MDKNVLEDMVSLITSGKSPSKSMADIIMDGIKAESSRKEANKNRHKEICGDDVYFDTKFMVEYLKDLDGNINVNNKAYFMGFVTKEGQITKKGKKFLRNNA